MPGAGVPALAEGAVLEHDDSAFHYFSIAILTCVLIPLSYKLVLQPMFYGEMVIQNDHTIKNC